MTILDKIIAEKYKEVNIQKQLIPISYLEKRNGFNRNTFSLKDNLLSMNSSGIIAEFKRQSFSKGIINAIARVEDVTEGYVAANVSGLSILTDNDFFGGSPSDLMAARFLHQIPILRKDFIIDEYQIIEARAMGADVILLIAAVLKAKQIKQFATLAKSLGMEVLFEIHSGEELAKITDNMDMIGINNRNLKDFKVDIEHSLLLASQIPGHMVKVSESGIDSIETINKLKTNGFKGFLIGENFMKTTNPGFACKEFIRELFESAI